MSDELKIIIKQIKIIIKQNSATHKLLQSILVYLGMNREDLHDLLENIQKEIDKEIE